MYYVYVWLWLALALMPLLGCELGTSTYHNMRYIVYKIFIIRSRSSHQKFSPNRSSHTRTIVITMLNVECLNVM
jgi:hypothetical protein